MEDVKVITGADTNEVWLQIEADFRQNPDLFEYSVIIEQEDRSIALDIDIDLGGGFEGGYALTRFSANLKSFDGFRFSLHRQDFIDGIGKFLGMKDVKLGFAEFDKQIVVKTSHPERLQDVLSEATIRETIQSLPEFTFHIGHRHSENTEVESAFLELRIDDGITEPAWLRQIYNVFLLVLGKVDLDNRSIIEYY